MKALETTPTSWRARLWPRFSDPDQWPRCWWFPPSSRRDAVLHMPEAARQDYRQVVQQAHEKFSETVRLAMLSLLGFALFCLLIALGTPDSALLGTDPTIKMPFADVQVSFYSFLILAPFLLIVVMLYLHIFYGYWLDLERDYQCLTQSRESHEPPMGSACRPSSPSTIPCHTSSPPLFFMGWCPSCCSRSPGRRQRGWNGVSPLPFSLPL